MPGIGPSRARAIRSAWSAQREVRKVMVFLQGYGVSPAFAARIYKKYGAAAIARVRENPYRLAFDVWGIGFLSADKLAAALGVARDAPSRAEAGVRHVLDDEGGNGHVFVARPRLAQKAAALLDLPEDAADAAIDRLAKLGDVALDASVVEDARAPAVYEAGLYKAETALAAGLRRLLAAPAPRLEIDQTKALAWYEREAGIALARQQAEAVTTALTAKVAGDHRRPGRRQDDDRARHRVDPRQEGRDGRARGADGARGQAALGCDRRAGVDAAPPAGMAPRRGELLAQRRAAAGGGRADRRRGVDGRRPAGRRSGRRAAGVDAAGAGGRRRSAAVGRARDGAARTSSPAAPSPSSV